MVTIFYAGILGVLFFIISIETIKGRRKHLVSIGNGDNQELAQLAAAHSNFTAYAPFFLILLGLLEQYSGYHFAILHLFGGLFTLGRLLHFRAFNGKMNFKLRKLGMHLTLWPFLILSIWAMAYYLIFFIRWAMV
jgi:hypothetical protein